MSGSLEDFNDLRNESQDSLDSPETSFNNTAATATATASTISSPVLPNGNSDTGFSSSSSYTTTVNHDKDLLDKSEIQKIMNSDVAINALLSRLKQSLLTCEEFIKFIRKKCTFEDEHTQELLKQYKHFFISSSGVTSLKKSFHDILEYDGKLGTVKQSYVKALQKMYDEISSLLLTMTKMRKNLKEKSRRLEKEVTDSIHNAEKAQNRYTSLCQDYDKLRMVDPTKTKLTLRGSKTTKEQEEELLRKIDNADLEYKQKVDHSNSLRDTFLQRERPKIVAELKDLILEMDTAMAIQLQKYSIYTENLILNSGVTVSPFEKNAKSMKSISSSVRNERDLYNFLNKYNSSKMSSVLINKNLIPVNYKKHPSMVKHTNTNVKTSSTKTSSMNPIPKKNNSPYTPSTKQPISSNTNTTSNFVGPTAMVSPNNKPVNMGHLSNPVPNYHQNNANNNNVNSNNLKNMSNQSLPYNQSPHQSPPPPGISMSKQEVNNDSTNSFQSLDPGSKKPNRLTSIPTTIESLKTDISDRPLSQVQTSTTLPPGIQRNFKTFGVPLESLIEYEHDMVPAIVRQCIFVIDKYGLQLEGIYRKSANVLDVSKLKEEIDRDPSNISMLLPPRNYSESDIYLVGSILKTFFASLPNSLLPAEISEELRTCMSLDEYTTKKNYMHSLLYKLPDAQYWTLRSLLFHLKRILKYEEQNRMNLKALCIIWGPTIIPPNEDDINDVNYQIQAMEVLIDVADQAFEPE